MKRQLAYAIVADGGTDRVLESIIRWTIHQLDPNVELLEPDFVKRKGPVRDFIGSFDTGAMLVFVHRDSEGVSIAERLREFEGIDRQDFVAVVPVRMTESWLLFDSAAISRAAGRPESAVTVPAARSIESLADPKQKLESLLVEACGGLSGRRLKSFKSTLTERRVNVASFIEDFSPLRQLPSFVSFEEKLRSAYPYPIG